jgi:hypothetical protein
VKIELWRNTSRFSLCNCKKQNKYHMCAKCLTRKKYLVNHYLGNYEDQWKIIQFALVIINILGKKSTCRKKFCSCGGIFALLCHRLPLFYCLVDKRKALNRSIFILSSDFLRLARSLVQHQSLIELFLFMSTHCKY